MHTPCRAPRQLCSLADWRKNFSSLQVMTLHIELQGLASVTILVYISYQQTIQKKWFCSYKICDMKFVIWHERCQVNKLRQVQEMHILDKNAILWIELGFVSLFNKNILLPCSSSVVENIKIKNDCIIIFFSSPTWSPEIICAWIFLVKVFLKDTWSWNYPTTLLDSVSSCFI